MNDILKEKRLIVLVGPSGSGKSTIIDFLAGHYPDTFAVPRSVTSRQRREGETGNEYDFVTKEEFEDLIRDGALLEHSVYANCYYGLRKSSVDDVIAQGKFPVRAMDFPGAVAAGGYKIFLDRNTDDLLSSILGRDLADSDIVTRLRQIPGERKNAPKCDAFIQNNGSVAAIAGKIYKLATGRSGTSVDAVITAHRTDGTEASIDCMADLLERRLYGAKASDADRVNPDQFDRATVTVGNRTYPVRRVKDPKPGEFAYGLRLNFSLTPNRN